MVKKVDAVAYEPLDHHAEVTGMTYTHLTQEERYQIYILKKTGHKPSEIAKVIGWNKSTISRELSRNSGRRGYRPQQPPMPSLSASITPLPWTLSPWIS